MTKRTDELVPGDRVRLASGIVRTVAAVTDSGYVNNGGKPILNVTYAEAATAEWSGGNSGVPYSRWEVV